jgi:hypothetical protein
MTALQHVGNELGRFGNHIAKVSCWTGWWRNWIQLGCYEGFIPTQASQCQTEQGGIQEVSIIGMYKQRYTLNGNCSKAFKASTSLHLRILLSVQEQTKRRRRYRHLLYLSLNALLRHSKLTGQLSTSMPTLSMGLYLISSRLVLSCEQVKCQTAFEMRGCWR